MYNSLFIDEFGTWFWWSSFRELVDNSFRNILTHESFNSIEHLYFGDVVFDNLSTIAKMSKFSIIIFRILLIFDDSLYFPLILYSINCSSVQFRIFLAKVLVFKVTDIIKMLLWKRIKLLINRNVTNILISRNSLIEQLVQL